MKKNVVLLWFVILSASISRAGAPPELYCQILMETEDFEFKDVHLYLAKDEAGQVKVHLTGITTEGSDIPDIMRNLDSSESFGTVTLVSTRQKPGEENIQFHISFPTERNFDLPDKEGMKDSETGEVHWMWKEFMCEDGEVVDVNAKGSDGNPYLISSIRAYDNAEKISAVLKAGADPNVNDKTWGTPLSNAAMICASKIVEVLLKAGAKVNEKDSANQTAIGYSSLGRFPSSKCVETAELLLRSGATVKDNCDVLLYASEAPVTNTQIPSLVEKLIAAGGDVNCKDDRTGATPLINACSSENAPLVKTLLAKGADPNIKMNDGATALKIATEGDNQEIIQLLKTAGPK